MRTTGGLGLPETLLFLRNTLSVGYSYVQLLILTSLIHCYFSKSLDGSMPYYYVLSLRSIFLKNPPNPLDFLNVVHQYVCDEFESAKILS